MTLHSASVKFTWVDEIHPYKGYDAFYSYLMIGHLCVGFVEDWNPDVLKDLAKNNPKTHGHLDPILHFQAWVNVYTPRSLLPLQSKEKKVWLHELQMAKTWLEQVIKQEIGVVGSGCNDFIS